MDESTYLHKILEKELKSEEKYQMLFNSIDEGFCIIEMIFDSDNKPVDYRFLEVNKAFEEQTGLYDAEGKTVREMVPEHEQNWFEIYGEIALTGKPERFENKAAALGKYYEVYAFKIGSPKSRIVGVLFKDITERKRTEEEMVFAKEQLTFYIEALEGVINNLPTGVNLVRGSDLTYRLVNPAYQQIAYGKEILGKSIMDVWPEIYPQLKELYTHILETGNSYHAHDEKFVIKRTPDGPLEEAYFDFSLIRIKLPGNEGWGILNTATETTERKKAEEELRQAHDHLEEQVEERTKKLKKSEKRLEEAQKMVHLGNWEWNITTNELYWSDEIYRIFGRYPQEFGATYDAFLSYVHPEDRNYVDNKVKEALAGKPYSIDHKIILTDGKERIVHEKGEVTFNKKNNPIRMVGTVQDVTDQRLAEKLLKETIKELERSNQELQSFAYITSHDLQEPLRTIASYAQLLKRRYKGQLDNDADEFIDYMVAGSKRMKAQIQGLLEYSRVGTHDGDFWKFNAGNALKHALFNLSSSIEDYNAEITYDPLPIIIGDETQIIRVFQNLIGNALKFRRAGVQPKIHISSTKDENEYIFSVSDNGIGIEEEYNDRIFEVFKRLHAIGEYEGAGIGLAIVKRIIERHGGRVWVESEYGKGATFYFTIPIMNR